MCASGGMMEPPVTNQPAGMLTGAGAVVTPIGQWVAFYTHSQ